MEFLENLLHADNKIYAWTIIVSLYLGAVAFVIWHAYVWKVMSADDKRVRGGILILMLNNASATLATTLGYDSLWRRFFNVLAGVLILVGMTRLIWKFRFKRRTAALQPHIGDPSLSRPLSDTLGNDSSNQGDPDGFQER